ncbi:MAG: proton-conducting membrane transporter [Oscillospiraceae bacterium]|nr:proton-conducting membrane transporter [Oscillospiraceae bacterium]
MLTYFVIIPILIATFLYLFSSEKAGKIIALTAQALLVIFAFYLFISTREYQAVTYIGNFYSVLGITLRADNLSAIFVLLTAFIFLVAAIYSYNEKNSRLFWFLLFIWEGALIGIFLTRDFFNIFVLIEVANVVVTIMIMYLRRNRSMYDGIIYLMANLVAIQFYLLGLGYVYRLTGVLDMDAARQAIALLPASELVLPYALIMTTVAFKCALMPLYSWLPKAHGTPGAPSAVSAILSGLHIKSGVYLFLRFQEVFGAVSTSDFFLAIGVVTGIVGVIMAISQTDMKLILAYSTIAQIGLIMIGFGLNTYYSHTGSLFHMINHALFKAALFLSAGIISHAYHTRDITEISGVLKRFPTVGAATILAILGIAGAPLFNGSISKYFMMSGVSLPLFIIMSFINLGTITICIKYASILFGRCELTEDVANIAKNQKVTVLVLGSMCFLGGILGTQFVEFLFGEPVGVDLFGYLEKVIAFAVSLVVGYFIFTRFVKRNPPILGRIRAIDLSFRGMCVCMGLFFAITLIATQWL